MTAAKSDIAVIVPALGEAVTEATNTRWLKAVASDEPLLEVATDKVDSEIPSRNYSEQPCTIAFLMIGADPV
jgi:2-oxoglutarate dehydrogenase E2 component (dihydrolipoamide succinyltransferase)